MPSNRYPNAPTKPPYIPVTYAPRRCITCNITFTPKRDDQIFCSNWRRQLDKSVPPTCDIIMRQIEESIPTAIWYMVLEGTGFTCFWCGVLGVGGTVDLHKRGVTATNSHWNALSAALFPNKAPTLTAQLRPVLLKPDQPVTEITQIRPGCSKDRAFHYQVYAMRSGSEIDLASSPSPTE